MEVQCSEQTITVASQRILFNYQGTALIIRMHWTAIHSVFQEP